MISSHEQSTPSRRLRTCVLLHIAVLTLIASIFYLLGVGILHKDAAHIFNDVFVAYFAIASHVATERWLRRIRILSKASKTESPVELQD